MKKKFGWIFGITVVLILSIGLVAYNYLIKNNKNDDNLSSTKTIVIGDKHITDKSTIDEIITIISSGIKMSDDEDVPYIGPKYILEMLDNQNKVINKVKVFRYWNEEGQVRGWVVFESSNNGYYVDIEKLIELIER